MWAVLEDGQLHDTYWDGHAWHEWHTLGSPDRARLVGQPAAAARGPDRIDVFAIGDDGKLWRRWWDGSEWVSWRSVVEAPPGIEQVAADWIGGRLDLYVRDRDGDLWYIALSA